MRAARREACADRAAAAALVGWNPLFAIHFAGGGHNDALLAALVLGALALAAAGRRALAGAAWAGAVLLKWIPVVFLALRALEARATGRRVDHRGFAVAGLVLLGLATWRYGFDWVRAFGPLARNAEGQTSYALPHRVEQLGVPHGVALALAALVLAAGLAWLVREALRGRARLGLSACLLLATTPWLAPWYTIWALPLAAAEDDRRAQLIAARLLRVPAAADDSATSGDERRGFRPRRRRVRHCGSRCNAASAGRARSGARLSRNVRRRSSTTTHSPRAAPGS